MRETPSGFDNPAVRQAVADVMAVPAERIEGVIIIAVMVDRTFMLLHTAASTADACDVAMQVFSNQPHEHDEVIGVLL